MCQEEQSVCPVVAAVCGTGFEQQAVDGTVRKKAWGKRWHGGKKLPWL